MSPKQFLLATMLLFAGIANAADVPKLQGRVNDYAQLLHEKTRAALESKLAAYERETTHQIAVLTVRSLGGENIEAFSLRVADSWELGRKGVDNGVLLTVARAERQVRIELGEGMARYVTDADAQKIIDEAILPSFRNGDYDVGVRRGIDRLLLACRAFKAPAAN